MRAAAHCEAPRSTLHWWMLGAAILSSLFLMSGVWAVLVQAAVLIAAVRRLTTRRSRGEATVLWIAIAVIVLTLAAATAVAFAALGVSGESFVRTVPVDPR